MSELAQPMGFNPRGKTVDELRRELQRLGVQINARLPYLYTDGTTSAASGDLRVPAGNCLYFGDGADDATLTRAAANVLGLGSGDTFRIATDGALEFGTDVSLARVAANILGIASGDYLRIPALGRIEFDGPPTYIGVGMLGDLALVAGTSLSLTGATGVTINGGSGSISCSTNVTLLATNRKLYFGAAPAAGFWHDGTDFICDPQVAGAGCFYIETDSFPVLRNKRNTSATNSLEGLTDFWLASTGNMADGFGPSFNFAISDNGVGRTVVGKIGLVRDGADTQAAVVFENGDGVVESLRVSAAGDFILGTARPVAGVRSFTVSNTSTSTSARARITLENNESANNILNLMPSTHGTWPGAILMANNAANRDIVFRCNTGGATTDRLTIDSDALQVLVNSGSSLKIVGTADKLLFASDVELYRGAANVLYTPDTFDAVAYKVGGVAGADFNGDPNGLSNMTFVKGILTSTT